MSGESNEWRPGYTCMWKTPLGNRKCRIVETGKEIWGRQTLVVLLEGDEKQGVADNSDLTLLEKTAPPPGVFVAPQETPRKNMLAGVQGVGDEFIKRYTHV